MTDIIITKNKLLHLVWLLCGVILTTGCVDENLIDCDGSTTGGTLAPDEYGIGFEIAVDKLGGTANTRALVSDNGNVAENYVNFNSMRILFFDKDDNFICDLLTDTEACNVIDRSDSDTQRLWYIEIALSKLDDKYEEKLRELIANEGFKVAVFANWDRRSDTHPDFISILDKDKITDEKDLVKTKLSYIAHSIYDPTYSAEKSEEGVAHTAYTHLIDSEGRMGLWYDWVESHFASIEDVYTRMRNGDEMKQPDDKNADSNNDDAILDSDAERWIYHDTSKASAVYYKSETDGFEYWRTERDKEKYTFKNIWNLWNFSNGKKDVEYHDMADKYKNDWQTTINQNNDYLQYTTNNNEYIFNANTFNELKLKYRANSDSYNTSDGYIHLAKLVENKDDQTENSDDAGREITEGYVLFKAEARGTLRIRAKSDNNAYIGVHVGSMHNSGDKWQKKNIEARQYVEAGTSLDKEKTFTIKVSGDNPDDVYIYAANGDIDIYEIEFVKDEYLYIVDRIGKEPKYGELGIPMYGIQKFEPVGDYWLPGEYFNVSRNSYNPNRPNSDYKYRHIWLLRSVAKVELKVSKNLGGNAQNIKPSSVYMFSMNRTSRYEPKDFSTPTNLIWQGRDYYEGEYDEEQYNDEGIVGVDTEAENIKEHGPIYIQNKEEEEGYDTGQDYRNFTAWVYGIWTKIMNPAWDWNNQVTKIENEKNLPYPRVFNDRVWRANNTRFIYGGDYDGYYHYYLYVPEKYIDDSDDTGDRTVNPKVASINLRFKNITEDAVRDDNGDITTDEKSEYYTDDTNIENNRSFRIYFTEGGMADLGFVGRGNYNEYERGSATKKNYLEKHWPIIRNTIYRFTLNGLNSTDIKVEVCNPASREVDIDFN